MVLNDLLCQGIEKQVLPNVIWEKRGTTPHSREWTCPLHVSLAVQVHNTHCRRIQSLSYGYATSTRQCRNTATCIGTNLIHNFTAVTFSMKLAFFVEKCVFP